MILGAIQKYVHNQVGDNVINLILGFAYGRVTDIFV